MKIEVDGKEYVTQVLDPFEAFALASKLSPILAMMSLSEDRKIVAEKFPQSFTALAGDMRMTRADKDEVIALCLGSVRRIDAGVSVSVMVSGKFMFRDMDLSVVLKIMWAVIEENRLVDFFSGSLSSSTDQQGEQSRSTGSGTSERG